METQRDTGATVSDGPVARLQRRDTLSVAAATRTVMRTPPAIATEALTELCRPSERASPYCASSGGERPRSRAAPASDSAWPWAATRCSHSPSLPCCPSWHWHSPHPATAARRQRPPRTRCVATTRRGHLRRGRRHCHTRCLATRRLSARSSRTSSTSTQRGAQRDDSVLAPRTVPLRSGPARSPRRSAVCHTLVDAFTLVRSFRRRLTCSQRVAVSQSGGVQCGLLPHQLHNEHRQRCGRQRREPVAVKRARTRSVQHNALTSRLGVSAPCTPRAQRCELYCWTSLVARRSSPVAGPRQRRRRRRDASDLRRGL